MREADVIGVDERELDDATLLALADVYATPPPSRLRARVLQAARAEARVRGTGAAARRWRAVGAVAAVAALALGAFALRTSRVADSRTLQLAALARTNGELSARLDAQDRTLAGLREAVAAQAHVLRVLAGPRTVTAALEPKEGATGTGRVVVDASTGEGAIVLAGLPPLAPDRAYELWTIRGDGPPEPTGVFTVEAGGAVAARTPAIPRPDEVTAFALSIEPAGGSPSPTGPIVLIGPVAS